ncbi:hypothetical protein BC939DRAFT_132189 [Gamsiella multidivaricata]|uniref:uncharacterized protein n=1 Tax=Gamsiella multidivaricata TaxID=101098 RepID=UPI00221FA77E|nr:uncharacterized protein BC939DRAFT_132189 [Gamsiella multidivaricata]KAI7825180.1 hypothetical protein BC939DRAFT_132189 [Gamsiella multidivaricata]
MEERLLKINADHSSWMIHMGKSKTQWAEKNKKQDEHLALLFLLFNQSGRVGLRSCTAPKCCVCLGFNPIYRFFTFRVNVRSFVLEYLSSSACSFFGGIYCCSNSPGFPLKTELYRCHGGLKKVAVVWLESTRIRTNVSHFTSGAHQQRTKSITIR